MDLLLRLFYDLPEVRHWLGKPETVKATEESEGMANLPVSKIQNRVLPDAAIRAVAYGPLTDTPPAVLQEQNGTPG
jgi:hypothetical protein